MDAPASSMHYRMVLDEQGNFHNVFCAHRDERFVDAMLAPEESGCKEDEEDASKKSQQQMRQRQAVSVAFIVCQGKLPIVKQAAVSGVLANQSSRQASNSEVAAVTTPTSAAILQQRRQQEQSLRQRERRRGQALKGHPDPLYEDGQGLLALSYLDHRTNSKNTFRSSPLGGLFLAPAHRRVASATAVAGAERGGAAVGTPAVSGVAEQLDAALGTETPAVSATATGPDHTEQGVSEGINTSGTGDAGTCEIQWDLSCWPEHLKRFKKHFKVNKAKFLRMVDKVDLNYS